MKFSVMLPIVIWKVLTYKCDCQINRRIKKAHLRVIDYEPLSSFCPELEVTGLFSATNTIILVGLSVASANEHSQVHYWGCPWRVYCSAKIK